jgi:hypothetical protein
MAFIFAAMLGEGQANHQGVRVFLSLAEAAQLPVYHRSGDRFIRRELMTERAVRIVKRLGSVPRVAACTACGKHASAIQGRPSQSATTIRPAQMRERGSWRGLSSSCCGIFLGYNETI